MLFIDLFIFEILITVSFSLRSIFGRIVIDILETDMQVVDEVRASPLATE